jgi:uncharacterized membrane protein YfcA
MDGTLVIPVVAFLASLLTLISGFGLGTLMLPVFAIFYPVEIAVALTAVVHFLNNLFKLSMLGKYMSGQVVLWFGIPSLIAAFFGALALSKLSVIESLDYRIGSNSMYFHPLKSTIGILIIVFAIIEIWSITGRKGQINKLKLIFGGLLSGFFGGLSGHQGALRTTFIAPLGLAKEVFVATGVVIACMVDFTRLSVYWPKFADIHGQLDMTIMVISVLAAFLGAFLGRKLLGKMELSWLMKLVAVMLVLFGVLMVFGVI